MIWCNDCINWAVKVFKTRDPVCGGPKCTAKCAKGHKTSFRYPRHPNDMEFGFRRVKAGKGCSDYGEKQIINEPGHDAEIRRRQAAIREMNERRKVAKEQP